MHMYKFCAKGYVLSVWLDLLAISTTYSVDQAKSGSLTLFCMHGNHSLDCCLSVHAHSIRVSSDIVMVTSMYGSNNNMHGLQCDNTQL